MTELETVVRVWAADYYLTLPDARRAGVGVFVADMLELLRLPGGLERARKAARARKADYVVTDLTPAQAGLRAALIDHYRRAARQHPHLADEAAAFADGVPTKRILLPRLRVSEGQARLMNQISGEPLHPFR